jgi:hypothetical protein
MTHVFVEPAIQSHRASVAITTYVRSLYGKEVGAAVTIAPTSTVFTLVPLTTHASLGTSTNQKFGVTLLPKVRKYLFDGTVYTVSLTSSHDTPSSSPTPSVTRLPAAASQPSPREHDEERSIVDFLDEVGDAVLQIRLAWDLTANGRNALKFNDFYAAIVLCCQMVSEKLGDASPVERTLTLEQCLALGPSSEYDYHGFVRQMARLRRGAGVRKGATSNGTSSCFTRLDMQIYENEGMERDSIRWLRLMKLGGYPRHARHASDPVEVIKISMIGDDIYN